MSPPKRRARFPTLSLRTLGTVLTLGGIAYLLLFGTYVLYRVNRASADLRVESASIPRLYGEIAERTAAAGAALRLAQRAVLREEDPMTVAARLRAGAAMGANRVSPVGFADVPEPMQVPLARADALVALIQVLLGEFAAAVELGQVEAMEPRMRRIDSLHVVLTGQLADAQRAGLEHLVGRADAVGSLADQFLDDVVVWLVLGIALFAPGLLIVWRRLGEPLAALEVALNSVAAGSLSATVPVTRDDELGRVSEHFNHMMGVLRKRAETQGRFAAAGELVAGVAHEVNNPLMAVSAIAQNRLHAGDGMPAVVREDLTQINRQAMRAARLLSGLLRFVRADDEDVATPTDLNQVVGEAIDLVGFRFPVDEIELRSDLAGDPPLVPISTVRGEQVLVNLLSNAIDALATTPRPRVLLVRTWVDAGRVCASVEDSGPGIPPEVAPRLFNPFVSSKGSGGTGLGLYMSREILRAAGGELMAETSSLGGARFVLWLPVAVPQVAPDAAPAATAAAPALAGLRVLLIDDEEAVRRPTAEYLRRRGAAVTEAENGRRGLEQVAQQRPDVVVVDLRMPVMDGPTFYRALSDTHPELTSRVLFLTGDIQPLAASGVELEDPDRVVQKPVELPVLEQRIALMAAVASRAGR